MVIPFNQQKLIVYPSVRQHVNQVFLVTPENVKLLPLLSLPTPFVGERLTFLTRPLLVKFIHASRLGRCPQTYLNVPFFLFCFVFNYSITLMTSQSRLVLKNIQRLNIKAIENGIKNKVSELCFLVGLRKSGFVMLSPSPSSPKTTRFVSTISEQYKQSL